MAKLYFITFTLRLNLRTREARDYESLKKAINKFGKTYLIGETDWLVYTEKSAETMREALLPLLQKQDTLVIASLGDDYAYKFNKPETAEWFERYSDMSDQ